jgi:23S rRNA pseudouridine2605 synthase
MSKNFKKKDSFSTKDKKREGGPFNPKSSPDKRFSKESFNKKDASGSRSGGSRERTSSVKKNGSDKKKSYNDFKKSGDTFRKKESDGSKPAFRDKNITDKKGNYRGSDKDFKAKPANQFNKDASGSNPAYGNKNYSNKKDSFKKDYKDKPKGKFDKKNTSDRKPAWGTKSFSDKKDSFKKDYKDKPTDRFNKKDPSDRKPSYGKKSLSDKKDSFKKDYKNKPTDRFNKRDASDSGSSFREKKFSDKKDEGDFKKDNYRSDKIPFKPKERSLDKTENKEKKSFGRNEKPRLDKKEFKKSFNKADKSVDQPQYNIKKPRFFSKNDAPSTPVDDIIRLNKYISNAGVCSRRDADKMIEDGMIKVNGKVVTEMGYKVNKSDIISYGKRVLNKERPVYLLLNKPKDFITTTDDPNERKTVMDLVGSACKERIYPVGRLDRNTTGLLLLTNDGELAEKLTHPSNEVKKVYQVDLDKPLTDEDLEKITKGLELEDGSVRVDEIAIIDKEATSLGIEIHEGRNRIVRRIFEHLGYQVVKLDRVMYAGLDKKDLPRGKWRFLSEKEVIRLKYFL